MNMTGNDTLLYDRVSPVHQEAVTVDDGREYLIDFLGSVTCLFTALEKSILL